MLLSDVRGCHELVKPKIIKFGLVLFKLEIV